MLVSWGVTGNSELPPGATQVEFTLTATPTGTRLRLVHSGLPPQQESVHATGWQHFLDRLSSAATGADPGPTLGTRPPVPGSSGLAQARRQFGRWPV